MELIVISEKKLKIMLTAPDMARYELEGAHMDCADTHTRAAFRHIFHDARAESGFDTEGERLFVQLYASKEGGCEIFVTKLGREESSKEDRRAGGTGGEDALLRRLCTEPFLREEETMESISDLSPMTPGVRRVAVVFDDSNHLTAACRRLLRDGYRGRSDLYITEAEGTTLWYLLPDVPDVPFFRLPLRFAFLTEYGREVEAGRSASYLAEHGRMLCEGNAVEVMGVL